MTVTTKGTYPVHLTQSATDDDEIQTNTTVQFKNHFFDYKDSRKSQRVRRDDISTGIAPMRSVDVVRTYFKTNESKILPHIRDGLEDREDSLVNILTIY